MWKALKRWKARRQYNYLKDLELQSRADCVLILKKVGDPHTIRYYRDVSDRDGAVFIDFDKGDWAAFCSREDVSLSESERIEMKKRI